MDSSLEKMETSETESPSKSGVEPSSPVQSNGKAFPSRIQSSSHHAQPPQVDQVSQEKSSQAASSSSAASSQIKSSNAAASSSSLPSTSAAASSSDNDNGGPAQKKQRLDYKAMPSAVYLDSTVVPILHVALVTLDRLRPADPVQFVVDFLLKNKSQYSQKIPSTSAKQA